MGKSKLIGLVIGTSLVFSGLLADSAKAQTSNQSHTSGTNFSHNSGTNFSHISGTDVFYGQIFWTEFGGLNPQILDRASQFADQLTDAYVNCNTCGCNNTPCNTRGFLLGEGSTKPTTQTTKPRTFALGEKDPNQSCPSPSPTQPSGKCEELTTVLNESRAFLDQVKQQVEATKTSIIKRTW